MDLAEQLDPEDWHKIMERFFAILSRATDHEGGLRNRASTRVAWRPRFST
jgi:class 3 adenylate cyclase